MTYDLYAELGIDRDSHADIIRAAYRRRAKKAHPDAGGSAEAFERLQLAHAVLSDPKRRARYDETGDYDNLGASNADADALGLIGQLLAAFLDGEEEPSQLDLGSELTREARRHLDAVNQALTKSRRVKARAERLLGRFRTMDGNPTPAETMLRHQIGQCERAAAKHEHAKAAFERAIAILATWRFDRELSIAQQQRAYASQMNSFSASTTASTFTNGLFR